MSGIQAFFKAQNEKTTANEVKSGNASTHPSLDCFTRKYKGKTNKPIILTKAIREKRQSIHIYLFRWRISYENRSTKVGEIIEKLAK